MSDGCGQWLSEGADAFRDVVMPVEVGIMGLAFTSKQVVFVPHAHEDDRWFDVARVHQTGMRSAFAVPLVSQRRALGVVGLDTPRFTADSPPGAVDVARLEALAAQAAIAIDEVVPADAIWLPRSSVAVVDPVARPAVTTLAEADRNAILSALEAASWRISGDGGAAERLGTKPTTLHSKMKKLGIRRPSKTSERAT